MDTTLLGIFSSRVHAENAISELTREGFDTRDISLVMKTEDQPVSHNGTNMAEGAASGVVTGGVLGGLAGLLIGLGAITLPGIGGLLVAGPIAAALGLVGAAAATVSGALTGAVAGGIVGALVGLGLPEEEAKAYASKVRDGGILIAVPAQIEDEQKVRNIFVKNGADMIRSITSQPRRSQVPPQHEPSYNDDYYNPERYSDYPNESYSYYSDVRPLKKTTENKTAASLKEKLRKLFG
jgi:uncharacterized membrane protein